MGKEKAERDRSPFGQRLQKARKAAKLSIEQAAAKLSLSVSTISEAENKGLGSAYVVQFADLYGVSPWWLAMGRGPERLPASLDLTPDALRIARQLDAIKDPTNRANALAICDTATLSLAAAPRGAQIHEHDEEPEVQPQARPQPAPTQKTRT